jgi:RimJ/RimL family protein N-acetyltransferase
MELKTQRLILKKPIREEAEQRIQMFNNPNVAQWLFGPLYPYTRENWDSYLEFIKNESYYFSIWYEGKPIGCIDINKTTNPTLGYSIDEPYWGQGFAKESVKAIMDYWNTNTENTPILVSAVKENERSIRIIEHFGFKFTRLQKKAFKSKVDGQYRDLIHYTNKESE